MPVFNPDPIELLFWDALALIAAACLFAPLFRRLGLGAILGYLAAGVVVRLALRDDVTEHPEALLEFAEFGVVLFLFVIGLELKPSALWRMRTDVFGLGFAQMALCGLALAAPAYFVLGDWTAALLVGLGLALTSTAIAMKTLDEKGDRGTDYGRKSFAVLLFQDLAIVPLLLLVAILAPTGADMTVAESATRIAFAAAAIAALILAGRFLLDPMFQLIARAGAPELMTASALGVVIAAALLMNLVGMSYAMGAFLAGVMLSESAYRHELEANIEPFRGLFLGLFFMAVGLSLDLAAVLANWAVILAAAPIVMAIKIAVVYGLGRAARMDHGGAMRLAFTLPTLSEFAFVFFGAAAAAGVVGAETGAILIAIVTVSMALAPLFDRLAPLFAPPPERETINEDFDGAGGHVLIVGFGRFGQIVSQPFYARGLDVTILDFDAARVRDAASFGFKVHFGDGRRRDVLRAAGAGEAEAIVVAVDDPNATDAIVAVAQAAFPNAKLFVRAYDRGHTIALLNANVACSVRETFESALTLSERALVGLGVDSAAANAIICDIRRRDQERLDEQVKGDIRSGMDRLHTAPVRPEPLTGPGEAAQAKAP